MIAKRVLILAATTRWIAEMEDGEYRWVNPNFDGVSIDTLDRGWVERVSTARAACWYAEASIQEPFCLGSAFLETLNQNLLNRW